MEWLGEAAKDFPGWISAVVAVVSAMASGVAWWRARAARNEAQSLAKASADAAQSVAVDVGVIASIQEAQRADDQDRQALLIYVARSVNNLGRSGWVVKNASDAPITNLQVTSKVGSTLFVYRPNGNVDNLTVYQESVLEPGMSTATFQPLSVQQLPGPPEIEQLDVVFTDARSVRWGRFGNGKPDKLDQQRK